MFVPSRVRPIPIYRYRYRYPIPIPGYIQTDTDIPQTSHTVTDTRYRYIGMIPIYRYDTDIHADITLKNRYDTGLPIPISQIFPYRTDNRYRVHTDLFHTDTDTGYRSLVSVPGIGIIPGIGRTLADSITNIFRFCFRIK